MKANTFAKNVLKLFLILLASASFECNDNPLSPVDASLGTDFDIKFGQTAILRSDSLYITFKDVAEARCPIGLQCFAAGNANITLMIQQRGMTKFDTLRTDNPVKIIRTHTFTYYKFTIKDLTPYPVYQKEMVKEKYTVTLNVVRLQYIRK